MAETTQPFCMPVARSLNCVTRVLTWQKIDEAANRVMSGAGSRISRAEGMEGHARACDWRLRKYFPDEQWDFDVTTREQLENR